LLRPYDLFFKRLLSVTAQTIFNLSKALNLGDKIRELSWNVMKVLLSQETEMIIGRHLDQMILCVIYGVCRLHPKLFVDQYPQEEAAQFTGLKFNTIIEAYRDMTSKQKVGINNLMPGGALRNMTWVLVDVPIDLEKGVNANIIDFYNKCFLPRMGENLKASR
jgi:hypothetical protein